MIRRLPLSFCLMALLQQMGAGVALAEDSANLSTVEPDDENFSLDAPPDSEDSPKRHTQSNAVGKDSLTDFGSNGETETLNLGDKKRSVRSNVDESVGLDIKEPRRNDTPKSVLRDPVDADKSLAQKNAASAPITKAADQMPASAQPETQTPTATQKTASPVADTPAQEPAETPPLPQEIIPENNFAGTPYVQGGRRVMALGEAPEYYKVEDGDTLYDICDQLIDEAKYWPKLWALNPGIKNPHFIFPGMTLSFYPGDDATPPYLQVVSEDEILPIETGGLREVDLVAQPTESIAQAVATPLPESLNERFIEAPKGSNELSSDIESFGNVYQPNVAKMEIPAFYFEDEVSELGTVLAGPKGEVHVPEEDEVIVEVDDQSLSVGSLYTVLRPSGRIQNAEGDSIGYRYEYVAQIKIIEKTDEDDAVMAHVVKSRLGVKPEDLVVNFKSTARSFTTDIAGVDAGTKDASVVGFEYPSQTMAGQGQVVFVDKQFSPGVSLPVYQRMDQRLPRLLKTDTPVVTSRIGVIRIIDTVGTASVGVVIKNKLDVRIGDKMGRG